MWCVYKIVYIFEVYKIAEFSFQFIQDFPHFNVDKSLKFSYYHYHYHLYLLLYKNPVNLNLHF